MNVTSEILFYLYSEKYPLMQEHTGALQQPVTSIKRLAPGEAPDEEANRAAVGADLAGAGRLPGKTRSGTFTPGRYILP